MTMWKKVILVGCMLAMMVPAFGCSEEGTMEKMGKQMDDAVEESEGAFNKMVDDAKDAVDEATK